MAAILDILRSSAIRAELRNAWEDSRPGPAGGHEEGGFIVQEATGSYSVMRWPRGEGDTIALPPHSGSKVQGLDIEATFHTHPNSGEDYLQQPSETDERAVRDDPDLKGHLYQGELVITQEFLYLVTPQGTVLRMAETAAFWTAT